MNKKVKTTKFKVIDAERDKKLVGEVLVMQKIKPKGGTNNITTTKKQKSTRDLLIEFMAEQRAFNTRIEKEVLDLRCDVSNLRHDVENLKNGVTSLTTRVDNLVKVNKLSE